MKLRIRGNTIRLRLTQSEVRALHEQGRVEEQTRFRPGERLVYTLETSLHANRLMARFEEGHIMVVVPVEQVAAWAASDQVSLEGEQSVEHDDVLKLLIEKDFQCLHRQPTEDDADTFPHPIMGDNA